MRRSPGWSLTVGVMLIIVLSVGVGERILERSANLVFSEGGVVLISLLSKFGDSFSWNEIMSLM